MSIEHTAASSSQRLLTSVMPLVDAAAASGVDRKHRSASMFAFNLDGATSAHVWSVGHEMARALRRSGMRCEGINVLLCDGEVAFQTVFHFHLHVIPRYAGDGWTIKVESQERERSLLDSDAQTIKDAIASTD